MIEIHTTNCGALLVQQIYNSLIATSREEGGELNIRMNFILDEFANFTKIDTFQSMLTVSRGRNIRFVLCVQTLLSQMEEKYGKEGAQNIIDNCSIIYLKSGNVDSANKISDMLGTYTVQSYGESSNSNFKHDKSSSSMSLISRKLLTPDEVMKIESPYALVMLAGKPPAIMHLPDISKTHFNKLNGMGTKAENLQLRIERENNRETKEISQIKLWDIWNEYKEDEEERYDISRIRHNFRIMQEREKIENKKRESKEDF